MCVTKSDSEYCLCPEKTAALNGFDCEREDDGFGWLFSVATCTKETR